MVLDRFGFLTLCWPSRNTHHPQLFFVLYGFKQNNHTDIYTIQCLQDNPAMSRFFAKIAFQKLVKAIDMLKQAHVFRRIKRRQDMYMEELMKASCHPERIRQIDA
jgi:hypothetical protein